MPTAIPQPKNLQILRTVREVSFTHEEIELIIKEFYKRHYGFTHRVSIYVRVDEVSQRVYGAISEEIEI